MIFIQREGIESRKLSYDSKVCLACGLCADSCPTDSLAMADVLGIARGQVEGNNLVIDDSTCVLCGLCSFACAFGALKFEIDGEDASELANYPNWEHDSGIAEEDCEFCGRCYEACPQDTIVFKRILPDKNKLLEGEISIDEEKCIYCSVCADLCPAGAITISAQNGRLPDTIEVDEDKCVYCGVCKRACPQTAIKAVCSTCMHSEEFEKAKVTGTIFIGDDCINCGWCKEVCPVSAAEVSKPFEGQITTSEEDECVGCGSCVDICSCKAVELVDGVAQFNQEYCVLCGACARLCPQQRITVAREDMKLTNVSSASWKATLDKIIN